MEIFRFAPGADLPFSFKTTVGGEPVFGTVPYNLYAKRYYLKLSDSNNNLVVYTPLVGSPDDYDINLALPYRPGSLVYRASTNNFEAN